MKLSVRITLWALCALLILLTPFVISSPQILEDARWEITELLDDESGWFRLFNTACAEEWEDAAPAYELPFDTTPGMKPNPACYTENGYEDDSISVRIESIADTKVTWQIAWVTIASPTQLRTAFWGKNVKSDKTGYVTKMAEKNNAVVAMNGSRYSTQKEAHTFEVRMTSVRQTKLNNKRDILITDENGDFHLFIQSKGADTFEKDTGHKIINAMMFGPALVKDGEVLKVPSNYLYNPSGQEPRAAIGQVDKLTYVMVIADTLGDRTGKKGVTHQELADYMAQLGCTQAYNLDGGNSAILVFNGRIINHKAQERDLTDIIYFATAIPEEAWK